MSSPSDWQLIDDGRFNGVKKFIRSGDDPDSVQVRYEGHDIAPIIEANKAAQAEGFDRRGDMWHAARIPVSVMYEWLVKFGINAWNPEHQDRVMALLNSNDYRYLRVKNFII